MARALVRFSASPTERTGLYSPSLRVPPSLCSHIETQRRPERPQQRTAALAGGAAHSESSHQRASATATTCRSSSAGKAKHQEVNLASLGGGVKIGRYAREHSRHGRHEYESGHEQEHDTALSPIEADMN
eukprot:scaffold76387_cov72-Phaeocystis_antarctica.AAC.2